MKEYKVTARSIIHITRQEADINDDDLFALDGIRREIITANSKEEAAMKFEELHPEFQTSPIEVIEI